MDKKEQNRSTNVPANTVEQSTDNRPWWKKAWDWVTGKKK